MRLRTGSHVFVVAAVAAALLVAPGGLASGSEAKNRFVGAWESIDPPPDSSHVRMQISQSGRWHLRDEQGTVCENNGYGFVAATASGIGEFREGEFWPGGAEIYCYPRDRRGREYVVTTLPPGEPTLYDEDADVLIDAWGVCWWRSGIGSPGDCE